MALQKQSVNINFSQGLNTKTDPKQVSIGQFLKLENSIFTKAGLLQKRNGFGPLTQLPDDTSFYLTTFGGGLTALGSSLYSYSTGTKQWVNKGRVEPIDVSSLQLVRSSTNQIYADSVVSPSGLICTTYIDVLPDGNHYRYTIEDTITGQVIISPTELVAAAGFTINSSPRVFLLPNYFIIAFGCHPVAGADHIQYIAISLANPMHVSAPNDLSNSYAPASIIAWDGVVFGNTLYVAFNSVGGGQSIKFTYLPEYLIGSASTSPTVIAGEIATMFSLYVDTYNPANPSVPNPNSLIYVSYYDAASGIGKMTIIDKTIQVVLAPVQWTSSMGIVNIASVAYQDSNEIFYETNNSYPWGPPTHFISKINVTLTGTVGSPSIVSRSVGLASKGFMINGVRYILTAYQSNYQDSYFLMDENGNIVGKLAYSNGGGYLPIGLPSALVDQTTLDTVNIAYRLNDLIAPANKGTNLSASTPVSPVYSQTGINLAIFDFTVKEITSGEIGGTLNLSGGLVWSFDGLSPVELGFNVWPDDVNVTSIGTGGSIAAGTYFYSVTYEWTDNNGNINRSAPSVPVTIVTSGSSSTVTLRVPTLRLTYKTVVAIVVYRWSAAQEVYYAIRSPAQVPILNDETVDYVTITDTSSDAQILGNPILYTTGGVIENIGPPATKNITLFNDRLFLSKAEDPNLLWYSKQVIEATPVEMSDLLTIYVAPTVGAQGSTGDITALAPMDDKLIIFKKDAAYYINGIGPDNTGANSQYSDPVFITAVVGCDNQNSIVFIPMGLMFQSDKGIWLLGRDLSTQYIGAPVESFTQSATVKSALAIAGTNQVRFTLDNGITLMYDYFYGQWGTFTHIPAISSILFQTLHTYITDLGTVFQETPNQYLDNSNPVLMAFTTSWISMAGFQGYERFYKFFLVGNYFSPFRLDLQLSYDFNPAINQSIIVDPINYSPPWGDDYQWGYSSPWGGQSSIFEARIFPRIQRCESFQITMNEIFDPKFGTIAGAGLTLSGLNLVIGAKSGHRIQKAIKSYG